MLPEMKRRYSALYGDEAKDLYKTLSMPLLPSLRVNTLKTSSDELFAIFDEKGVDFVELGDGAGATILRSKFSISSMEQHLYGHYYMQGVAEMAVSPQLGTEAGDLVWDMCAAPGGKTTHIAQLAHNGAEIVATDVSAEKLKALKNNIARTGVTSATVYGKDARDFFYPLRFDKVLLDAPCTGSGIMRKDPSRGVSRTLKDVAFMSGVQKGLLEKAVDDAKDGATILYSTCSLEPEENEEIIDWALGTLDVDLMALDKSFLDIAPGFCSPFGKELDERISLTGRVHPHINDTNGMFIAKLKKGT